MTLLDGKSLSKKILSQVKLKIDSIDHKPTLACVLVGDDSASKIYVNNKIKACNNVGMNHKLYHLDATTSQQQLDELIESLSHDNNISGILVQLPLPKHLDARKAISHIDPRKDVDGLTNVNLGKLTANENGLVACTAQGIVDLMDHYNISLKGKNVVIIGHSLIVGRPLVQLLLNNDATVTICHKETVDIKKHTQNADIIVTAVGKKGLINSTHIKKGAVLIDVAIVRVDNKIYGDIDYLSVKDKASYITPVPGGVGPLTVAHVIKNTLIAHQLLKK